MILSNYEDPTNGEDYIIASRAVSRKATKYKMSLKVFVCLGCACAVCPCSLVLDHQNVQDAVLPATGSV